MYQQQENVAAKTTTTTIVEPILAQPATSLAEGAQGVPQTIVLAVL